MSALPDAGEAFIAAIKSERAKATDSHGRFSLLSGIGYWLDRIRVEADEIAEQTPPTCDSKPDLETP